MQWCIKYHMRCIKKLQWLSLEYHLIMQILLCQEPT